MVATVSDIALKCAKCGTNLVRVSEPEGEDRVFCTECGAFNNAKAVFENSAGLIGGVLTPEQVLDLREKVRLARKQAN